MERLQRLAEFWNWLPAFRAVAETMHLPAASEELGVSASALSRTVHLLEKNLGKELFNRNGRNLELNDTGELFLARVRDAMRLIDEGLASVTSPHPSGPLHISTVGLLTEIVSPLLGDFHDKYPAIVLHQHHHPATQANGLLTQGQLDVAFLTDPIAHPRLHIERVGSATNGIYCGRAHPLFRTGKPALSTVLKYPFAAPAPARAGTSADNWPVEVQRDVGVRLTRWSAAVEICRGGHLLAVLPDRVGGSSTQRASLRRLPVDIIPPTTFYAARRETLVPGGLPEEIIEIVKKRLNEEKRRAGKTC